MSRKQWGLVVLLVVALAVVGVAVHVLWKPSSPTSSGASAEPISFRLKWRFGGTSCGVLVAKKQGYFSQVGLDVTIGQGGFEYDSKKLVATGTDQIGLTGADELILARAAGMPLVAIGVDFQKTPCCILAVEGSGITKPQDLAGKRLGVRKATNAEYQYQVMMKRLGLDLAAVQEEPIKFDLTRVVEGKLDMWTTYTSERPLAEAKGLKLSTIWFADYGIRSYGNVVFTSESFLREHPEVVRRFLKAYYQGWKWAMDNTAQVGEVVRSFSSEISAEAENAAFALTIPLLSPEGKKPLGFMTEEMWEATQQVLIESGQLDKPLDMKSIFSNEYLPHD